MAGEHSQGRSHDIIAHETTYRDPRRYATLLSRAGKSHVLAFHEAFADLVALFQHFTYPEIPASDRQSARRPRHGKHAGTTRSQFGKATGGRSALRDAFGKLVDDKWERRKPDPQAYVDEDEPHAQRCWSPRCSTHSWFIYRNRTRDLLRIATGGSGFRRSATSIPTWSSAWRRRRRRRRGTSS